MRKLSPEEQALWAKVAATIRPLSRDPIDAHPAAVAAPATIPTPKVRVPERRAAQFAPQPRKGLHEATLDGGWDRDLKAGRVAPERTLDLHGYGLDRAWDAIDQMLERAIASGDRVLLLITGHLRNGDPPLERGRIRAAVHDWLEVSRHASRIAAVRAAHPRHGGGGSLYIILRKS